MGVKKRQLFHGLLIDSIAWESGIADQRSAQLGIVLMLGCADL